MRILFCLLFGYFVGSLNPAAWVASKTNIPLEERGTKNLGASNVFLVVGKKWGMVVLCFDVLKAYFSAFLAEALFPGLPVAGLLAGGGAVVGHVFPFYMGFRGGKGLASFAGMVLSYDPSTFLFLFVLCGSLMLLANYSFVAPLSAGVLFPVLALFRSRDLWVFLICGIAGALVFCKNLKNVRRDLEGDTDKIRDSMKEVFLERQKEET